MDWYNQSRLGNLHRIFTSNLLDPVVFSDRRGITTVPLHKVIIQSRVSFNTNYLIIQQG